MGKPYPYKDILDRHKEWRYCAPLSKPSLARFAEALVYKKIANINDADFNLHIGGAPLWPFGELVKDSLSNEVLDGICGSLGMTSKEIANRGFTWVTRVSIPYHDREKENDISPDFLAVASRALLAKSEICGINPAYKLWRSYNRATTLAATLFVIGFPAVNMVGFLMHNPTVNIVGDWIDFLAVAVTVIPTIKSGFSLPRVFNRLEASSDFASVDYWVMKARDTDEAKVTLQDRRYGLSTSKNRMVQRGCRKIQRYEARHKVSYGRIEDIREVPVATCLKMMDDAVSSRGMPLMNKGFLFELVSPHPDLKGTCLQLIALPPYEEEQEQKDKRAKEKRPGFRDLFRHEAPAHG